MKYRVRYLILAVLSVICFGFGLYAKFKGVS